MKNGKLKQAIIIALITVLTPIFFGAICFGQVQNSEITASLSSFYSLGEQYVKTNTAVTSGTVTTGKYYVIGNFVAGDNFTNIGASSNASGVTFKASGTTPTTWTNGSLLAETYYQEADIGGAVAHGTNNGAFPALGQNDPAAFNYYEFDGAATRGRITDNAKIQNIWEDGGYAGFWIYPKSDGEGNEGNMIEKVTWNFYVLAENANYVKLRFYYFFSGSDGYWTTDAAVIPLNAWSHVAVTYDNSAIINNPTITVTTAAGIATEYTVGSGLTEGGSGPTGTRDTDVGSSITLGNGAGLGNTWDGYIRGVQLFNYVPSSGDQTFYSEILNHPKFADIGATSTQQTSGTLTIGKTYRLTDWITDDDFTNIGAGSNADGVEFVATGITPDKWENSSKVTPIGNVLNLNPAGMEYETSVWHDFYNSLESTMTSATHYGNGHNGRNVFPSAMYFDGTAYIDIDNALTPLASTTTGTWGLGVCLSDATPTAIQRILTFGDTGSNEYLQLYINTAGYLGLYCVDAGAEDFEIKTDAAITTDGVWVDVSVTQNGTTPILYADGVAVAQTANVSTDLTSWLNQLAGLDNGRIGCLNANGGGNTNFFQGVIEFTGLWSLNKSSTFPLLLNNIKF